MGKYEPRGEYLKYSAAFVLCERNNLTHLECTNTMMSVKLCWVNGASQNTNVTAKIINIIFDTQSSILEVSKK